MICRELIELLEKKYPPSIAESWDNPGLQVGSYEKEIKSIYIALDATGEVIRHAIDAKADLLHRSWRKPVCFRMDVKAVLVWQANCQKR